MRRGLPPAVLVLGLLMALPGLSAQEQADTRGAVSPAEEENPAGAEPAAAEPAGGETGAPAPAPGSETSADLLRDTLLQDIQTASYYELVAWCRDLGLDDAGGRSVLERRLVDFYRLEQVRQETVSGEGRVLEIRSATEADYFTIEEIDENYVLLQGDVLVELREKEAVHRIRAGRIILNQAADLLEAEGGIEYTLVKGKEEEVFHGEKLTFDIKDWQGVFFRGGIEADRTVGDKSVRFRFEGETITRLEGNTVVMDRGSISSCEDREEPHYQVRARKIWILAPGEWAILSAVLYTGRIPVLYLPFYFHAGDEFFFHPALGIREREGYFLQTTTYLVGQKPPQTSALSFLAAAEQSTVQYKKRIRGLFLRSVEGEQVEVKEDRFLKVLLDVYSRLGLFAGVSGSFPPQVTFQGGIGLSRNIYEHDGVYVPFAEVDGEYRSVWNDSWLFGIRVPFRYGIETSWTLGKGDYKFSGKVEQYSDALFQSDFYSRSEDLGLTRLAGLEEATAPTTIVQKQALGWEVSASADFSRLSTSPLLQRLAVPYLNASLVWEIPKTPDPTLEPEDPNRLFYYPSKLKAPSASVQISGELLRLPRPAGEPTARAGASTAGAAGAEPGQPPKGPAPVPQKLRRPGALSLAPGSEASGEAPGGPGTGGFGPGGSGPGGSGSMRAPAARKDLPSALEKAPLGMEVTYQVRPNVKVEETFDAAAWNRPEKVDGDLLFTSLDTYGTTSVDYSLKVLENLLVVGGGLSSSASFRRSFDQGYGDPAGWARLVLNDYSYSKLDLRNTFTSTLRPLAGSGVFGNSYLSYSFAWSVFRYQLEDSVQLYDVPVYSFRGPEWSPDGIIQNSATGVLSWRAGGQDNTLSVTAQLPPRAAQITGNLAFQIWLLQTTVNSVFQEDRWSEDIPLVIQEQLKILPEVRLTQELQVDAVEGILTRSLSSINLWGLSASFTADRLQPNPASAFEPALVSASYKLAEQELYLWKNRIHLQASVSSGWNMNLRDPTQNNLDFSFTFKMFVHEFLELAFTSVSYNNQTYKYFRGTAATVGVPYVNPLQALQDLARSFNFFNEQDRRDSDFNLKSINLTLIHHLHDWDLTLQYTGSPQLILREDVYRYEWNSVFSIQLQWVAIPEMRSTLRGERVGREPLDFTLRGTETP